MIGDASVAFEETSLQLWPQGTASMLWFGRPSGFCTAYLPTSARLERSVSHVAAHRLLRSCTSGDELAMKWGHHDCAAAAPFMFSP